MFPTELLKIEFHSTSKAGFNGLLESVFPVIEAKTSAPSEHKISMSYSGI